MKKLFALVLALIFALSFAVPALAFTEVEYDDDDNPVTLAIKLIDVGDGIVNVNFTAPPSNRGYVKNEVVCAIVSMYVPKGVEIKYDDLIFSGDNVTLWQDENFYGDQGDFGMLNHVSSNVKSNFNNVDFEDDTGVLVIDNGGTDVDGPFQYAASMSNDNEIVLQNAALDLLDDGAKDKAQTYHFAIFGKVIGDDAWMKAKLVGEKALENAWLAHTLTEAEVLGLTTTEVPKPEPGDLVLADGDADEAVLNYVEIKDGDYKVGYFNPNKDFADAPAGIETFATIDGLGAGDASNGMFLSGAEARFIGDIVDIDGTDIVYYVEFKDVPATLKGVSVAGFAIVTDKKYNCKAMYIMVDTWWYQVKVVGSKYKDAQYIAPWGVYVQFEAVAWSAAPAPNMVFGSADGASLLARDIVEDIIWDVFGLNLNVKGQMKPEFWATDDVVEAEVQVSPWYNEVTVPAEIELEAPKTGDVVSALGFVLIAIAGLAFVAVRKVRA